MPIFGGDYGRKAKGSAVFYRLSRKLFNLFGSALRPRRLLISKR